MTKNKACISADIVASTSLGYNDMEELTAKLKTAIDTLAATLNKRSKINFYGRIVKGDSIECFFERPKDALRAALLLKTCVKAYLPAIVSKQRRLFSAYGLRLSIGVGKINPVTSAEGVWNGEAITRSGRKIEEQKTSGKSKVIVKRTLFFESGDARRNLLFDSLLLLIDFVLNKATAKQCNILYHKLMRKSEAEISKSLNMSQSAVNQHSTSAGWAAIDKALTFYEQYKF